MAITTFNPADTYSAGNLSNGNRTYTGSTLNGSARSVASASSGKWYWEVTYDSPSVLIGIGTAAADLSKYPGFGAGSHAYYALNSANVNYSDNTGSSIAAGTEVVGGAASGGLTPPSSGVIGIALDLDSGVLRFVRGSLWYTANAALPAATYFAMVGGGSSGFASTMTANFGQSAFVNVQPPGYTAGLGGATVPVFNLVTSADIATNAEAISGTSTLKVVTPAGMAAAIAAGSGGPFQPLATVLTNTTASFTTADETKLDLLFAPAYGFINLANQVLAGSSTAYVDLTGASMPLTAGVWQISYTVATDYSSSTAVPTIAQIVMTDSANTIVQGSQAARPGSSTAAVGLARVLQLTVATTGTYKLRASNGDTTGALTILNNTAHKSTLTWHRIA